LTAQPAVAVQEIIALLIVAAVAGIALWRCWQRRKIKASGCNQCGDKPAPPKESTIRFYRRQR
jgi:hypothetical protein